MPLVIPKHLISHQHNSSTRHLQREVPESHFLDAKKEESKQKRGELRSQIEERVRKLLNRPDIDLKNISKEEMQRIRTEIGDEYGIKAHKIRLLTSQIEFLDDKIKEFRSDVGCDGADQHTS